MAIDRFTGEHWFLSNFYPQPMQINGMLYPTVEHYFQAQKAANVNDFTAIAKAPTPNEAKRLGRMAKLRPDWEEVKVKVMCEALKIKFSNPELRDKLLATEHQELIEGNYWHDNFWGSCSCYKCQNKGKNMLGTLLMELREEIRKDMAQC